MDVPIFQFQWNFTNIYIAEFQMTLEENQNQESASKKAAKKAAKDAAKAAKVSRNKIPGF